MATRPSSQPGDFPALASGLGSLPEHRGEFVERLEEGLVLARVEKPVERAAARRRRSALWVGGDVTLTTLGIVFERRGDNETLATLGKVGAWVGVCV